MGSTEQDQFYHFSEGILLWAGHQADKTAPVTLQDFLDIHHYKTKYVPTMADLVAQVTKKINRSLEWLPEPNLPPQERGYSFKRWFNLAGRDQYRQTALAIYQELGIWTAEDVSTRDQLKEIVYEDDFQLFEKHLGRSGGSGGMNIHLIRLAPFT